MHMRRFLVYGMAIFENGRRVKLVELRLRAFALHPTAEISTVIERVEATVNPGFDALMAVFRKRRARTPHTTKLPVHSGRATHGALLSHQSGLFVPLDYFAAPCP